MCLISIAISAQNQQHMEFKGIPIDGNINSFVSKLVQKGFVKEKSVDNAVILKGTFTGKKATIYVLGTPTSKTVWKVAVYLDKSDSWYKLKSDYKEYVELFTQKYGQPSDNFEFFSKPYYEGDGYELQALRLDKCTYMTAYRTPQGIVDVNIASTCKVCIVYEDGINVALKSQEQKKSTLDDI